MPLVSVVHRVRIPSYLSSGCPLFSSHRYVHVPEYLRPALSLGPTKPGKQKGKGGRERKGKEEKTTVGPRNHSSRRQHTTRTTSNKSGLDPGTGTKQGTPTILLHLLHRRITPPPSFRASPEKRKRTQAAIPRAELPR